MSQKIDFSPPSILEEDIAEVVKVLRSGWITTGPKVKEFEDLLTAYTEAQATKCVSSATAALQIILSALGVGPGDEVITSAYTFTASASVIKHVGAKIILADVIPGGFHISPESLAQKLTAKTKAVIAVDFGGISCDYDAIQETLDNCRVPFDFREGTIQKKLGRPIIISDASHSLGAEYKGKKVGNIGDVTAFSFHAVKNLTTAEGGAIQVKKGSPLSETDFMATCKLYSLHGQDKDAWMKEKAGWRYDIKLLGYKFNMTDIHAALGVGQIKRYDSILSARKQIHERYLSNLQDEKFIQIPSYPEYYTPAFHLFPVRIKGAGERERDSVIQKFKEEGISLNVHFIPLPLMTAYINTGFSIQNYPHALETYKNMISLPLNLKLKLSDVDRICSLLKKYIPSTISG